MNRKIRMPLILLALCLLTGFSVNDKFEPETQYQPLLLSRTDLAGSVFFQPARDFTNPGKIYLYGDTIFIVDLYKGIHVIDNSTPATPRKTSFIHIPGVMDLAVKKSVLYADNAVDLVAINLKVYPQISILDRVSDVFPEPTPPDLDYIPAVFSSNKRPKNTVIVGWVK
ncbi:MAG: hypothetical protein U1C46_03020 [Bacteroidales bacterium]|nr:hypothetical protein [Bacteroidales bacterium]MDZ4203770.1 hypothetical protein [Bacteroidales bacterium]